MKLLTKHLVFNFLFLPFFLFAQENSPITCSDGIDNDGDGFIDCDDSECQGLPSNGCSTCFNDGLSFADFVIEYLPTCTANPNIQNQDPSVAIGVANNQAVTLGEGGNIILGFSNNIITNSGDNVADIWVFENGGQVESSMIELRPFDSNTLNVLTANGIVDNNADGYYEIGGISGSTSSIDLDVIITGLNFGVLKFDAISVTDVISGGCGSSFPGADIDAVCALSSIPIEICNNGIDDNNNGQIDEGCSFTSCDFDNSLNELTIIEGNVCVFGAIHIGDVVKLEPRILPPLNPTMGTLYFDETLLKLRVWNGTDWKDCSQ